MFVIFDPVLKLFSHIAAESASLDTLKNAIKGFQHIRVIECYKVAGVKMMTLTQRFQAEDVLNEFVSNLERFR